MREVRDEDLPLLFEQWADPVAAHMAASTAPDHMDRDAFERRWSRLRADETVLTRVIVVDDEVAGSRGTFARLPSGMFRWAPSPARHICANSIVHTFDRKRLQRRGRLGQRDPAKPAEVRCATLDVWGDVAGSWVPNSLVERRQPLTGSVRTRTLSGSRTTIAPSMRSRSTAGRLASRSAA